MSEAIGLRLHLPLGLSECGPARGRREEGGYGTTGTSVCAHTLRVTSNLRSEQNYYVSITELAAKGLMDTRPRKLWCQWLKSWGRS